MKNGLIDFNELTTLYGRDTARELLEMSIKEGNTLIGQLRTSVPARRSGSVAADAHQLKGMAATMTMESVRDLSYQLEQCAKSDTWDSSEELLQKLILSFAELEKLIAEELK